MLPQIDISHPQDPHPHNTVAAICIKHYRYFFQYFDAYIWMITLCHMQMKVYCKSLVHRIKNQWRYLTFL